MCCMYTVYSGMQEWVIQIPSIPILVSVLFPSLHLKYFRIKFLLLVLLAVACYCTPTDYGSLLDHVYINRQHHKSVDVVDTYYSDHDMICISLEIN